MKRGHLVRFCNIRKFFVPKGILKWVPKVYEVPNTSTNIIGPKGTKSCFLIFSCRYPWQPRIVFGLEE